MKKIIALMSIMLLIVMSTSTNVDFALKKVGIDNPTELTGTVKYQDLEGGGYLLETQRGTYSLMGNNTELKEVLGKVVQVTGKLVQLGDTYKQQGNTAFSISSLKVLGDPEQVPTEEDPIVTILPIKEKPVIISPINPIITSKLSGTLTVSNLEGKHFELVTEKGTYILTGKVTGLEKMIGKKINVTGDVMKSGYTIWQRGDVFIVKEWSELITKPVPVPIKPVPVKPIPVPVPKPNPLYLEGVLNISKIEGKHFELTTFSKRYVLVGNTKGMENAVGKKISVSGYSAGDASFYMRGPVVEVKSFKVLEIKQPIGKIQDVKSAITKTLTPTKPKKHRVIEIPTIPAPPVETEGDVVTSFSALSTTQAIAEKEVTSKKTLTPTKPSKHRIIELPKPPVEEEYFSFVTFDTSHFSAKNSNLLAFSTK